MAQGSCCRPGMTISSSETSRKVISVILKPVQSPPRAAAVSYPTESMLQSAKGCDCHRWHLPVLACQLSAARQLVKQLSTWFPEAVIAGKDRAGLMRSWLMHIGDTFLLLFGVKGASNGKGTLSFQLLKRWFQFGAGAPAMIQKIKSLYS